MHWITGILQMDLPIIFSLPFQIRPYFGGWRAKAGQQDPYNCPSPLVLLYFWQFSSGCLTIGCQTDLICFTCKQNGLSHCWFLWQLSCLEQGANETWVIGLGSEWVGKLCSGPWPQTLTPPLPAVLHMYAMAHYGDRAGGVDKTRQIYHLCQERQLLLIGQ